MSCEEFVLIQVSQLSRPSCGNIKWHKKWEEKNGRKKRQQKEKQSGLASYVWREGDVHQAIEILGPLRRCTRRNSGRVVWPTSLSGLVTAPGRIEFMSLPFQCNFPSSALGSLPIKGKYSEKNINNKEKKCRLWGKKREPQMRAQLHPFGQERR